MKLFLAAGLFFLISACNNSGSDQEKPASRADSLMDQVMEGHNRAMAKMNKSDEAQKKIQEALDSISRLRGGEKSAAYKSQLESALQRLKLANEAMEKWMDEFKMDSLSNDSDLRIKYLQSEKAKISAIKDTMVNSLQSADSILAKK